MGDESTAVLGVAAVDAETRHVMAAQKTSCMPAHASHVLVSIGDVTAEQKSSQ